MMEHARSGKLIVLEGPDGSGTTTQVRFLVDALSRDREVLQTAEPSDGPMHDIIRSAHRAGDLPAATIQLLFVADRAWHVDRVITPALERGAIVVSDRYALSTLAYGMAFGLDRAWLEDCNRMFPRPDVTILALPSLDVCMERVHRRGEDDAFERRELQERVHAAYRELAAQDDRIHIVDTSGGKEESAALILDVTRSFLS